jgi:hypothetical protein
MTIARRKLSREDNREVAPGTRVQDLAAMPLKSLAPPVLDAVEPARTIKARSSDDSPAPRENCAANSPNSLRNSKKSFGGCMALAVTPSAISLKCFQSRAPRCTELLGGRAPPRSSPKTSLIINTTAQEILKQNLLSRNNNLELIC